MIRIKSKMDGFRRCGISHPAAEACYPDGRFSKEELETLKAEPMLMVEEIAEEPVKGKGRKTDTDNG